MVASPENSSAVEHAKQPGKKKKASQQAVMLANPSPTNESV